jgi:uncharacterized membrane protein required for colicin V production
MPSPFPIGSILPHVTAGTWIDVACLLLVVAFAIIDAKRGFSTTLSVLLGLLIAVHAGYWLYPFMRLAVGDSAFCHRHALLGAILPYILSVLLGGIIYIVIRFVFRRFFKLIVEQPVDNILGAIAGIAKSMLVILLVFSCASLLPAGSAANRAFHQESRTGRWVVPVLRNVFQHSVPDLSKKASSKKPHHRKDKAKAPKKAK